MKEKQLCFGKCLNLWRTARIFEANYDSFNVEFIIKHTGNSSLHSVPALAQRAL